MWGSSAPKDSGWRHVVAGLGADEKNIVSRLIVAALGLAQVKGLTAKAVYDSK